jgi:signal transduction histidine kinase
MDPIIAAFVALVLGGAVGVAMGRAWGRTAGLEAGRLQGRDEGARSGAEGGRAEGLEEGRRTGLEEGRRTGSEEGRRTGVEEGRRAGVEEGRRAGMDEGRREAAEQSRAESEQRLRVLIEAVRRGRMPEAVEPGSPEADLRAALLQGWAPREEERETALREAIGRVSAFLKTNVRAPLAGPTEDADAGELRERIDRALGSLEDLDFFVSEIDEVRQGTDLAKLAQSVSREFAGDQDVAVRVMLGSPTVRADVNPTALMDALYLILHNAARFGGGETIDLSVEKDAGHATIRVRDRGAGFSEEAFTRAFDPFYSTSEEGLGLGLPHARKVIEGMGGRIELRNVPDGGAEVELVFTGS